MKPSKSTDNPPDFRQAALVTLRKQLHVLLVPALAQLRAVKSTVTTAALALRAQNADADADVSDVLIRSAADPLDAEIDRLEALFNGLKGTAPVEPAPSVSPTH